MVGSGEAKKGIDRMDGPDRTTRVLKLFTMESPAWTVENIASEMGVSVSSAYRYVAVLMEAGLLTTGRDSHYVLGPAIIQYDRQIQLTDPLLEASRPVMAEILRYAPEQSVVLLCRLYRDIVLCIHQESDAGSEAAVSYARGRPMPLFWGATSKIMLPYLQARELSRLYDDHAAEIAKAKLGENWDAFRKQLKEIRRLGHVITAAEVDAGRMGIGAPILDGQKRLVGSLSYVIPLSDRARAPHLGSIVMTAARQIGEGLAAVAA